MAIEGIGLFSLLLTEEPYSKVNIKWQKNFVSKL